MSMALFPMIQPQVEAQEQSLPLYKEVAWDFEQGKPIFRDGNPVIVTGKEAVKVWAYKALLTPRCRYEIYSFNFGSEVETLIGQGYSQQLKDAEAKRYVQEALLINPYITAVTNIKVSFADSELTITATIETVYGEVALNA